MVYIREHIPAKILKISEEIEGIFIELNLKGTKWLLSCIYNPNGQLLYTRRRAPTCLQT